MRTIPVLALFLLVACGDDGGGDAPDAAGGAPTCADYCAEITANCSAAVTQYPSEAACMESCAAFTVGTAADTSGNTLGCRLYHAGAAEGDATLHCPHAGPGGDGACGSNCEGFCTVALESCTGADEQFASMAECMTACAGYPDDEAYDITDTAGDTFACRLYHLMQATGNPGTHCPHIVEASATCQ